MEKREVLKFCVDNGFFLDRAMLEYFMEMGDGFREVILKLKSFGVVEKILSLKVFEKYKGKIGIVDKDKVVQKDKVRILKDFDVGFSRIEAADFVSYFRNRFEKIRDVLVKDGIDNLCSIRRVGNMNGNFSIIGMIYDKRITKNKNLLIEIEDLSGRIIVLVNRENKQLFEQAKRLFLDDILCFKCSGSQKMLFANEIIYPDGCLDREKQGIEDSFVAFVSDFHVGARGFSGKNLDKFISWVNGEVGDERSREIGRKVGYLVVVGDLVDGVGVYPGQDSELFLKSYKRQYEKLADILGRVRDDVEIVLMPGLHDAVWMGEPMNKIPEKWALGLRSLGNVKLVTNPCYFEIGGLKILGYYGSSLNRLKGVVEGGNKMEGLELAEEVLKRRHLASVYGVCDIIPNKDGDSLVLDDLPDVFVIGGQHKVGILNYNNILMISTSGWQDRTDFEAKAGAEVDVGKVPILNLKNREIKILDFSDDEVLWEKGDDLVCELGGEV